MDRKEELLKVFENNDITTIKPLVDEVVFLEQQLDSLKKLPFIKIHPSKPALQKATPAAKQYKELLQQYTNVIKILMRVSGTNENDEESPLRVWVKQHVDTG